MAHYEMLLQHNPRPDLVPAFGQTGFLFNTYAHLHHQQTQGFYLLSALNRETGQADARCAFFVQSGKALSPLAAPFGSIEWSTAFPDSGIDLFIDALLRAARSAGTTMLRLVNYPLCYAAGPGDILSKKLLAHGFTVVETISTFYLPVSAISFERGLVPTERRRINKCLRAGFRFIQWPLADQTEAVNFLLEARRQKGYSMTIATERLTNLLRQFPTQCLIFAVLDGDTIAALTVTIRVRHDILYNFQPASAVDYQTFSPMVLLIKGIHDYCRHEAITVFDLGPALDGTNQFKPGLARFKRNLGAQESPRLVFERNLSAL